RRWIGGVCAGLGDYFGIGAGWARLFFVLTAGMGGTGILAYVVLWIAMPALPGDDASEAGLPGVGFVAGGVLLSGGTLIALLLLSVGTLGVVVVMAPAAIATATAAGREGRWREKASLALAGIGLTGALVALNYSPSLGDRTERPLTLSEVATE